MMNRCIRAAAYACLGALAPTTTLAGSPESGVAAVINGKEITTAELDAKLLKTNMKLAQSLYDARKAALDQVIMESVLEPEAKAKGMTVEQLMRQRIAASVQPVTDADVQDYYDKNKARMRGRTLDQIGGQIKNMLERQRENSAQVALLTQLKSKAEVTIKLDPPRMEVAIAANDPAKGPQDAKVTIVEFSDFQ